jgi:hypothetical protein
MLPRRTIMKSTFALLACLVACAPPTRPPAAPAVAAHVATVAPASQTVVLPPSEALAPAPAPARPAVPCRALGYAPSICTGGVELVVDDSGAAGLADDSDFDAWFRAHGATSPKRDAESSCQSARLGAEEALICNPIRHVERGRVESGNWFYRVVERRQIYVVRGHRAVSVFDQPVRLMPLDSFEDAGPLFGVEIHLEAGALTVREHQPGSCATAREALAKETRDATNEHDATRLGWARLDRRLVDELCAGLGRYPWRAAGALLREAPARAPAGHTSF